MIERWGRLVALEGDEATVLLHAACQTCSGSGCGVSPKGSHTTRMTILRQSGWCVGQRVKVTISAAHLLQLAILGYGLPLSGFWVGLLAGSQWGDIAAATTAVAGMGAALCASRHWRERVDGYHSIQTFAE